MRRTVSRPICGVIFRRTACSATSRTVQRARPSGAGPHTIAIRAACCALSSLASRPGRGLSLSAWSNPSLRYRFATRETSRRYVPTASAVAEMVWPVSSSRSMSIRFQIRADKPFPALRRRPNSRRSAVVKRKPWYRSGGFIPAVDQTTAGLASPPTIGSQPLGRSTRSSSRVCQAWITRPLCVSLRR